MHPKRVKMVEGRKIEEFDWAGYKAVCIDDVPTDYPYNAITRWNVHMATTLKRKGNPCEEIQRHTG